jgi:DNA-binding response OmpR family regulator
MFENEGRQVTITFSSETVLAGDERAAPPAQTSVIASVLLPFGWDELVARVSSTQPVESQPTERNVFRFGDVCVDMLAMEVTRFQGVRVNLTAQEFKMLKFFLANPGRVISREELLNEAWGYENYPCTRTVDNHVLRLRQKLEIDPSEPVHFQTVIRVGYKFVKGEKVGTNSLELVR